MTTAREWVAGARPKTLGASVSPVLVGTAVASRYGDVIWWRAFAALGVALAMQVGVNYANDYSDGVKGVDTAARKGPVRLTASGLAEPEEVKRAAYLALAIGAWLGIVLAIAVDWRLILVGAACVLAAWLYSGGPKPYASAGLGELVVLFFFGFVATCGSAFVHLDRLPGMAVLASLPVGLSAAAILLVNNIRDIPTDTVAGKRTLAVRVGAPVARRLYTVCLAGAVGSTLLLALAGAPRSLIGLVMTPVAVGLAGKVADPSAGPPQLVSALVGTARFELGLAVLLTLGLWSW